jgi:hypothetical protein
VPAHRRGHTSPQCCCCARSGSSAGAPAFAEGSVAAFRSLRQ